jgi:hypothetical protein
VGDRCDLEAHGVLWVIGFLNVLRRKGPVPEAKEREPFAVDLNFRARIAWID